MSRRRLHFTPDEARQVLWVRCLEEADATGTLLPAKSRAAASRESTEDDDRKFLLQRADLLLKQLPAPLREPAVPAESWHERLPRWTPWAVVAGAFVLGWLTNELGPHQQINLLSFPLFGLIVWNLAVCGASLWSDWKSRRRPPADTGVMRRTPGADAGAAALQEFQAKIAVWEKPLRMARWKKVFHTAAIALALGIVAGMYMRGLAKEYTASWQSTFLNEKQVRVFTKTILGPGSLITRIPVPDPGPKNVPQPAGTWIHLWAASAVLFIVIPRLILINMARIEALRGQPDYRGEFNSWLLSCRSLAAGHTQKADVFPVHYEPEPKTRDSLRLILQHLWGAQVSADFQPSVAYNAEEAPASAGLQYVVLMFPLATTPETEIHGTLIRAMDESAPARRHRLIVLDAGGFELRFRSLPEFSERLAARRSAWEKVAGDAFHLLLLDEAARRDPAAAARSVFAS